MRFAAFAVVYVSLARLTVALLLQLSCCCCCCMIKSGLAAYFAHWDRNAICLKLPMKSIIILCWKLWQLFAFHAFNYHFPLLPPHRKWWVITKMMNVHSHGILSNWCCHHIANLCVCRVWSSALFFCLFKYIGWIGGNRWEETRYVCVKCCVWDITFNSLQFE